MAMREGRGRNVFTGMIAGLTLVSALTACSSSQGGPPQNVSVSQEKQEPVELSFMLSVGSLKSQEDFMNMFGNKIKEKFPHVTPRWIQGTDVPKAMTAGQVVDILGIAQATMPNLLLQYKLEYDVSPLIKKYKYDLSKLDKSIVTSLSQASKGGMYGLPFSLDSLNMTYNKGIFDKFGLPYPKDGMTWEELYEVARTASRVVDGVKYYGLGISFRHAALMDPLGTLFIDPKTERSNVMAANFQRMFQTLVRAYAIPNNEIDKNTYNQQDKLFAEHKLAMLLGPAANGARLFKDTDPTLNWDMATYPRYKEDMTVGPQYNPSVFFVTELSKNKETAFQVIAYMASEEMQKWLSRKGYYPAMNDPVIRGEYGQDLPFMKGKNMKAMYIDNPAVMPPASIYYNIADTETRQAFMDVTTKGIDVNTALREADERINTKITQEKAK
jgi:multiple sugar transport system substrate-binding protein